MNEAKDARDRSCTCHPDDKPPLPCPRKYALTECRNEATARKMATAMARSENLEFVRQMPEDITIPSSHFPLHVEDRMPEARRLLAAIQAMQSV